MGRHHLSADRLLRLRQERGSAVLEGAVAMGVAFLLLVLTVQIGMVITARHAAETATAAIARRASRPEQDPAVHEAALRSLLARSVPGATNVAASVSLSPEVAVASVAFDWDPPGPRWMPVRMAASARAARVHPP